MHRDRDASVHRSQATLPRTRAPPRRCRDAHVDARHRLGAGGCPASAGGRRAPARCAALAHHGRPPKGGRGRTVATATAGRLCHTQRGAHRRARTLGLRSGRAAGIRARGPHRGRARRTRGLRGARGASIGAGRHAAASSGRFGGSLLKPPPTSRHPSGQGAASDADCTKPGRCGELGSDRASQSGPHPGRRPAAPGPSRRSPRRALQARPMQAHALITESIEDAEGGIASVPGREFEQIRRQFGLPAPDRQAVVRRAGGRYYLDVDWGPTAPGRRCTASSISRYTTGTPISTGTTNSPHVGGASCSSRRTRSGTGKSTWERSSPGSYAREAGDLETSAGGRERPFGRRVFT